MIERLRTSETQPTEFGRDERSMRVVEYALAFVALLAAALLAAR